jgi:hypothetical protein
MRLGPLCLLLSLCLLACTDNASGPPPPPAAALETGARLRQLQVLEVVDVLGATGPGGTRFQAAKRTGLIGQYPCRSCHEQALVEPFSAEVTRRWSHLDIRVDHAAALRCGTCHNYEDLGQLQLIDADPVDFDHSYQVCAQCHSPQARDWAGGAHGKRLGGWRGDRVVETCTGCHDPHAPAFPKRMPQLYPQVPRTGTDR